MLVAGYQITVTKISDPTIQYMGTKKERERGWKHARLRDPKAFFSTVNIPDRVMIGLVKNKWLKPVRAPIRRYHARIYTISAKGKKALDQG